MSGHYLRSKGLLSGVIKMFLNFAVHCAYSLESSQALCDPMDSSPPGSSVHGIFQAEILEWVATSFFGGSLSPRD